MILGKAIHKGLFQSHSGAIGTTKKWNVKDGLKWFQSHSGAIGTPLESFILIPNLKTFNPTLGLLEQIWEKELWKLPDSFNPTLGLLELFFTLAYQSIKKDFNPTLGLLERKELIQIGIKGSGFQSHSGAIGTHDFCLKIKGKI